MKIKRCLSAMLILTVVFCLSACQAVQTSVAPVDEDHTKEAVTVLMFDEHEITDSEAYIYLYLLQKPYETYYGSTLWQSDYPEGGTWGEWLLSETKKQISEIEILSTRAEKEGLSLSEEEKAEADEGAAKLLETVGDTLARQYGITQDCVNQVYEKSKLAGLYYQRVLDGYEVSLTDSESAQCEAVDVCQLFIPVDESEYLEEGQTPLELAEALRQRLENGEDFETMAKAYSPDHTQYEFVLNREGYVFDTDAWLEDAFTEAAWQLEPGEISPVIETSYGYHLLKCVDVNSDTLKQQAREWQLEEKKKQLFAVEYENWLADTVCTEMPEWQEMHVLEGI